MKILVAYFSTKGNTKIVAKKINSLVDGDLFEIIPKDAYTDEDLDWTNKQSRSSIEMNDKNSRVEILNKVEDISKYDTLYIGFPIWWYTAPHIINSFLEQYDLSNKTIIPFATSGSSDIGNSSDDLKESAIGANVLEGKRFPVNVSIEELKEMIKNQKN